MTDTISHSNNLAIAAKSAQSSRKRSRILFSGKNDARAALIPTQDRTLAKAALARRIKLQYPVIPSDNAEEGSEKKKKSASVTYQLLQELKEDSVKAIQENGTSTNSGADVPKQVVQGQIVLHRGADLKRKTDSDTNSGILALPGQKVEASSSASKPQGDGILVKKSSTFTKTSVPTPKWHAPWELTTVLSSHLGWVRSIAFDPTNDMFATGSADRTIKIFDFAKAAVGADDALKITLTGHLSPIRGLAFSPRHPYLFSAAEDKTVKCWDLETNQVVRHYHGHLSGVFDLKLHPTLDLLVTGGRDAVARVWDMRTKQQVHCLTGHDNTVGAILTKSTDPQVSFHLLRKFTEWLIFHLKPFLFLYPIFRSSQALTILRLNCGIS
jgi:WD40 repeat protein